MLVCKYLCLHSQLSIWIFVLTKTSHERYGNWTIRSCRKFCLLSSLSLSLFVFNRSSIKKLADSVESENQTTIQPIFFFFFGLTESPLFAMMIHISVYSSFFLTLSIVFRSQFAFDQSPISHHLRNEAVTLIFSTKRRDTPKKVFHRNLNSGKV